MADRSEYFMPCVVQHWSSLSVNGAPVLPEGAALDNGCVGFIPVFAHEADAEREWPEEKIKRLAVSGPVEAEEVRSA